MKQLTIKKNDSKVIKIKLAESVETTGVKMLRLMKRNKELSKSHWAGVAAIIAGANGYSTNDYGTLRLICGVQKFKPNEEARYWRNILKCGFFKQYNYRIICDDVAMQMPKCILKRNRMQEGEI